LPLEPELPVEGTMYLHFISPMQRFT